MTITVKLFAILRDKAGISQTNLDLSPASDIGNALEQMAQKYSALEPHLSKIACAVNEQYMPLSTVLNDGDELALIPPVSGG